MRIPIALYLLALVARLVTMTHFPDPAYPDSFYYVDVARELAAGHGFNVDFIWIFPEVGGSIPANPVLPIPANAHWMPLASLVQVPFIWLLGPTATASALPFAFIGSLAAPLAWFIAKDASAPRIVGIGAGILTALPALSFVYMVQPDNFSLYQPLVAGALFLAARGLRGSGRAFALAGLLAGIATLSRNDGVLVLAVLGAAFLWDRLRTRIRFGTDDPRPARVSLAAALGAVALFAVSVGPWYLRQLAVFGSLSPSTASGKVLFIRNIGEWNSITIPANLDHLLGMGLAPLLLTRMLGFVAAAFIFSVLVGVLILVPFMLIGAWKRRRDTTFGPYFGYAVLLFAFSALVSAVHVPGGTFIHSAVALAPHGYVLALLGIVASVEWAARRRPGWNVPAASTCLRQRRGRVRRARIGPWGAERPHELGREAPADAGRRSRARCGRCTGKRPAHVHRCVWVPLLDRARWRRPRERPARDGRGGRPCLRHPVADPRARRQRAGGSGDPPGRQASGLGRPRDHHPRRRLRVSRLPR